ncbi:flavin-containing monooxygenase [Agrococcus sediminis]|uniref:flavin-containing monooxygenase n=1 Tax=Agrococcus sediminis TaxID=2599924 RepID=UPI0034124804
MQTASTTASTAQPSTTHHRIAIIGSGFAGLGLAIQLRRRGEHDFVVLERAGDVGGTWRDNTYPGAACDIQSHLYSYSFRPNPDWSRVYASQPEIHAYLREAAIDEGVMPHITFDAELLESTWRPERQHWVLETTAGRFSADIVVSAAGHLSDPKLPSIPGLERFERPMFHSAQWDHSFDATGKRVGVIGSGASGIQIVPELAKTAEQLTVFQRSAPYIIPRVDHEYTDAQKAMFRRMPETAQALRDELFWGNEARFPQRRGIADFIAKIEATALDHLAAQVPEGELRDKLTPDYLIGCKRILISNEYYPTFLRESVALETGRIVEVSERGIVTATADGGTVEHELDALVLATGFEASDLPITHRIFDADGRSMADAWTRGGAAYACSTVAGYPNLFIMNGPNSGLGAGSIIYIVESQIQYILGALDFLDGTGASTLEITQEAQDRFVDSVDARAADTVWLNGGCHSWYVDERFGRLTTVWPDFMHKFRRESGRFRPDEYLVDGEPAEVARSLEGVSA